MRDVMSDQELLDLLADVEWMAAICSSANKPYVRECLLRCLSALRDLYQLRVYHQTDHVHQIGDDLDVIA